MGGGGEEKLGSESRRGSHQWSEFKSMHGVLFNSGDSRHGEREGRRVDLLVPGGHFKVGLEAESRLSKTSRRQRLWVWMTGDVTARSP